MRWFKAVGGLLTIILLITSCIKVEGTIKIEDDGSGTVDYLSALDTESVFAAFGDFGDLGDAGLGDAQELCDGFEQDFGSTEGLPTGANVAPYEEDGFCGVRVQYDLPAALDHSGEVSGLFDDNTRVYKEGENWFFDSPFSADDITSETDEIPAGLVDGLFGDASFQITIDLPGRAIAGENNATEVGNDGRFTWDIDLLNPPARLFAQTEPGSGGGSGGGGNLGKILIALALIAILGAAAFLFIKRRNESAATAASPAPLPGGVAQQASANPAMPYQATPQQPTDPVMPLQDSQPQQVMPAAGLSDAAKETVLMDPAEAQRLAASARGADAGIAASVQDTAAAAQAATPAAEAATPTPTPEPAQPVYDEALGAWVVDDPARGRLRHDPATDTWNPV